VTAASPRRAALLVGTTLGLVYLATLAPGVTLWDAGEFASAVESLGIPHPPGTPLFVLVARAWRLLLPFLSTVMATNLLAAVSTAAAAAIAAALVARWTRDTWAAVAAGLVFGGMSTVWLNATETEVYSVSLLLSMIMLWVGYHAGTRAREPEAERRWDLLLVYLFALAPPLHLSAMVVAPGAIALATVDRDLAIDGSRAAMLGGAAVLAVGVGTGSTALTIAGVAILAVRAARVRGPRRRALLETGVLIGVVAIAASVFLFLLVRARLDPAINQGAPTTLAGVIEVIARRQYDVPGLWPRRAPLWLQIGNLFQYVDWQFALGLDRSVGASWFRTPFTPVFVGLGVAGSLWHRRRDRRSWAAMTILFATATLGVVLYLNLRAGPSFGYGVLPRDADREARERDYFFALGFAVFGLWAGQGAMVLARSVARHFGRPRLALLGVVVAALPVALNWRAVDRRREPAASLPNAFARATLESAPPRAVLFVAGDNDTYPLWYAQLGAHVRPDVSIVTVPLVPAQWYRAELSRRLGLYDPADTARWLGTPRELAAIAARVGQSGRPLAAAVGLEPRLRDALGTGWSFRGLLYVRADRSLTDVSTTIDVPAVDSTAASIRRLFVGAVDATRVSDPAGGYLTNLLTCPTLARQVSQGSDEDAARLLASRCNFR
jgi:hypothetical protein